MFYSKTANKIWLEANTEQSESNPGRSLGVNMIYKTAVWKTVPCWRAEGAYQCGTVFQTALFSLVINPETSSRVTLATLGIVFQTILFTTDTHLCFSHFYQLLIHIIYTDALFCYLWLPWSVAIRFGWKPIPSRARVTRDEVSGFITEEKRAVWKTVPHCCAPSPSAQSARAQRVHG